MDYRNMSAAVWQPLSTALPTEAEKRSNEALLAELRSQGTFESPVETQKREEVLNRLQVIANKFVAKVAEALNSDKENKGPKIPIKDARGRIFTYGSYRLGVFGPGSDIDTIIIAPKFVEVEHFFKYIPGLLMESTSPGEITDLKSVEAAFVPIIKFEFCGISIDLIFASIKSMTQLPMDKNWNLQSVDVLRGLTNAMVASLNGPRVTDDVLSCVPEQTTFKLTLRAIKLWAQRRGLYGAIYGYPGGVAWAIMVARVCQLYPRATSSVVVNRFFKLFAIYPWPQPVMLREMVDHSLGLRTWNPVIYVGDKLQVMPIITPTYPSFCTTHNVTKSALMVITEEIKRGLEITNDMVAGKRPWKELFDKHTFFTRDYKHYLTLTSISTSKDAHKGWSGFIESKSRFLAMAMDSHPHIKIARPYFKTFERVHLCKTEAEIKAVKEGSLAYVLKDAKLAEAEAKMAVALAEVAAKSEANGATGPTIKSEGDVTADGPAKKEANGETTTGTVEVKKEEDNETNGQVASGLKTDVDEASNLGTLVYTTTQFLGIELPKGITQMDISRECNKFCDDNKQWELFDENVNDVRILHIRDFNLPDDVFGPGETKPVRQLRKKRTAGDSNGAPPAKRQQTAAAPAAAG